MDYRRLALAAVVAWLVETIFGAVMWIVALSDQFASFPGVFRAQDTMNAGVPVMVAAALIAMFALAYLYAKVYHGGHGVVEGARFGLVVGVFTFCLVSVPMYATLNIGSQLATMMAVAAFVEMTLIGTVIGSLYRPAAEHGPAHVTPAGKFA